MRTFLSICRIFAIGLILAAHSPSSEAKCSAAAEIDWAVIPLGNVTASVSVFPEGCTASCRGQVQYEIAFERQNSRNVHRYRGRVRWSSKENMEVNIEATGKEPFCSDIMNICSVISARATRVSCYENRDSESSADTDE